MKKIMALALGAVLLLVSGVASADAIQGEVVNVDLEGNALEVKQAAQEGAAGENVRVAVSETTAYSGEVTAFAEIIEGDTAKIDATKDASGNWVANSVDISVEEMEEVAVQ